MTLSDQVRALTGPDHELDARIWCAVFAPQGSYVEQSPFNFAWCIYHGEQRSGRPRLWEARNSRVHPVTASFDAATRLLPNGFVISQMTIWPGHPVTLTILGTQLSKGKYWHSHENGRWSVEAATPALAVTLGALISQGK